MSNEYYSPSGNPGTGASGSSSVMRSEFDLIEAGLDLLPTLSANGDKLVAVNSGATALVALSNMDGITTNQIELTDYGITYEDHGNTSTTETIDLENGNVHRIVLDADCTLTFSNPPASGTYGEFRLIVIQDGTGSRTITWPASVDWPFGSEVTLSTGANDVDILDFFTLDGGTTWYGLLSAADMS